MFSDRIRRYGIRGFLLNAFCKSFRLLGIKLDFKTVYITQAGAMFSNLKSETVQFRELTFEDFKGQEHLNPSWFTPTKLKTLRRAFDIEGNTAYGAFDKELLICYGWISMRQWALESRRLLSEDGYIWDDYTHPDYRGNGLHRLLALYRIETIYNMGGRRVIAQVSDFNRASRVGLERSGFKIIEHYVIYQIWNNKEQSTIQYGKE